MISSTFLANRFACATCFIITQRNSEQTSRQQPPDAGRVAAGRPSTQMHIPLYGRYICRNWLSHQSMRIFLFVSLMRCTALLAHETTHNTPFSFYARVHVSPPAMRGKTTQNKKAQWLLSSFSRWVPDPGSLFLHMRACPCGSNEAAHEIWCRHVRPRSRGSDTLAVPGVSVMYWVSVYVSVSVYVRTTSANAGVNCSYYIIYN